MRVLVLGARGQIARALSKVSSAAGVEIQARGRPVLDLTREATIGDAISEVRPDIVINAAAYTAVDQAQIDRKTAFAVNEFGAGAAARATERAGLPLLHLSTDYVFDGRKSTPYTENDPTGPLSVYGESKLAGEIAVAQSHSRYLIVRTSWVFAEHGQNFVRTMLRLASRQETIRVVNDQWGSPTFADDVAHALLGLSSTIHSGTQNQADRIVHAAARGEATWFSFAQAILSGARTRGGPTANVVAITSAEYTAQFGSASAMRPANSRLASNTLEAHYGIQLPKWQDGLERCLDRIAVAKWNLQ